MTRLTPPAMLALVLLAAACIGAPRVAHAGEMGAYITLVNTYAYPQGPRQGNRVLIRSRVAMAVVDQAFDEGDRLWYQVLTGDRGERTEGTGWTPLTPAELQVHRGEGVFIYSRPLETGFRSFQAVTVTAADVDVLHDVQASEELPQIQWHKVHYATRLPQKLWVRGTAGIYRVGKSQAFLTQAYADMATRSVPKDDLTRLLSGVVRPGDSPQAVRWALGEPQRITDDATGAGKVTLWDYPEGQVRFENAVVKRVE